MIKHIVLWRLKDHAEGASKDGNVLKLKKILESLRGRIPTIRHIEVGINVNGSPEAYDLVLYSEFDNRTDLEAYQNHPDHVRAADFVGKVRNHRVVIDYEC